MYVSDIVLQDTGICECFIRIIIYLLYAVYGCIVGMFDSGKFDESSMTKFITFWLNISIFPAKFSRYYYGMAVF